MYLSDTVNVYTPKDANFQVQQSGLNQNYLYTVSLKFQIWQEMVGACDLSYNIMCKDRKRDHGELVACLGMHLDNFFPCSPTILSGIALTLQCAPTVQMYLVCPGETIEGLS